MRRIRESTISRSAARTCGACPACVRAWPPRQVASRAWCRRFSMPQCARDNARSCSGPACSGVRPVIAWTVSTVFWPRTIRSRVLRQTWATPETPLWTPWLRFDGSRSGHGCSRWFRRVRGRVTGTMAPRGQPAPPAHDAQLVAPAGEHRRDVVLDGCGPSGRHPGVCLRHFQAVALFKRSCLVSEVVSAIVTDREQLPIRRRLGHNASLTRPARPSRRATASAPTAEKMRSLRWAAASGSYSAM